MNLTAYIKWSVLLVALFLPCAALAEELAVCVLEKNAPYTYQDKSKKFTGLNIELWDSIKIEKPFRYIVVDFPSGLAGLEEKSCDVFLTNLSITKERAARIDFTEPYLKAGLAIMTLKNNTKINTPRDLDGKIIGVSNGTTGDIYVSKNVKAEAIMAISGDEHDMFGMLIRGEIDAIVHDLPLLKYMEETIARGRTRILSVLLAEEEYALGLPKGSTLKPALDAKINELRAGGSVERIYKSILNNPDVAK